jgi:transketolase
MGYKLTIEDLKQFRQVGSITPGHPEVHVTEGELSFSSLPGCLRS